MRCGEYGSINTQPIITTDAPGSSLAGRAQKNPKIMPVETIENRNDVTHARESQGEFRVTSGEIRGRFVPESALAELARDLTAGSTQEEIAQACGITQPSVHHALGGRSIEGAYKIIEHYSPAGVVGGLVYVPEHIDDLADERQEQAAGKA